jgi:secondary thiamine-phosphate synthase enzyme
MQQRTIESRQRTEFINITAAVQSAIRDAGMRQGSVLVFVPHTTAGVTINENADPDVVHDLALALDRLAPWSDPAYRHAEGNTAAHVKASLMGSSVRVPVAEGRLQLGTWQAIYFCEFDGPRHREFWISES